MPRRFPLRILVYGVMFTLVSTALPAQHALSIDAVVGFSGVFRAGAWTPVHVSAQNFGREVRGELEIAITKGDRFGEEQYEVRSIRELELVAGASKSFSFVVPLETTVYPVTLRVRHGGELIHEEAYDLLGRSVPGRLAVVVSRRPNLDFLLPLFNSQEERNLDVVYPLPDFLPESWSGYEGVDVVVIHDGRLGDLNTLQVAALRDWVASGGRIIVSGGAHFGPADAQTLAPLGDLQVTGVTTIAVEDTGLLESGLPIAADERRALVVSSVFAGGSTLRQLRIGSGDVIVLPFDYANLAGVAPLTSVGLWNTLLSVRPSERGVGTELRRRVFETELLSNQLSLPVYGFPSRLLVIGLGVSYVIGLTALLIWMRRDRGSSRAWIGIPVILAIALLVGGAGHLALTQTLQPAEALQLSVERADVPPSGEYAVVSRDTALFSRQEGTYRVSYADSPLLVPLDQRDHAVRLSAGAVEQDVNVGRWGFGNNLAVQLVPFDLRSRVTGGEGFVEIELRNRSGQRISNAVAIWNGWPTSLGSLEPGATTEMVVRPQSDSGFQAIAWSEYVGNDELTQNRARLVGDLARQQRFQERVNEILVVGWTEEPLLPVTVEPAFPRSIDLHVVVVQLPIEGSES